MDELRDRIKGLSDAKRALFERLLLERKRGAAPPTDAPRLGRVVRTRPLPCVSPAQERLWFLHELEPESPTYNIPVALRARGAAWMRVGHACFCEVWRRQEALRMALPADGGTPRPRLLPVGALRQPVVDLTGLTAADREAQAVALSRLDALRPFDLSCGPLFRVSTVLLDVGDALVVTNIHHVISDWWSGGVLASEVTGCFAAFARGAPSALGELAVQYADVAHWQRTGLASEAMNAHVEYWRGVLALAPELLALPWDRPRPALQSYRGTTVPVRLGAGLTSGLRELGRRFDATLFQTLLAVFQVLLARWSGQTDISVGSPIAGRTRKEAEGLIGMFVNTLVLRARLEGDPTFAAVLRQARDSAIAAYAHQAVPFERLVEQLRVTRSLSYSPLFQVMLTLQDSRPARLEAPGLVLSSVSTRYEGAKFDLSLDLIEVGGEITGLLEYNTDLFNATTMTRFVAQLEETIAAVSADPEVRLADIRPLGEAAQAQLASEWNDTAAVTDLPATLAGLVREQAVARPGAVAVVCGDQHLSYGELASRASRLAVELASLGVGPDTPVGLCCDRSLEMVVALVGLLQAGAAYVPLDPAYPRERLALLIEDSGLRLIVTVGRRASLFVGLEPRLVLVDDGVGAEGEEKAAVACASARGDDLAYVIYTSGSTGRPKGVVLAHRGAVNLCRSFAAYARLSHADRVLQLASLAFDVSVEEIFATLAAGATLQLSEAEMLGGVALADLVARTSLTVLNLATPYWVAVTAELAEAGRRLPECLRLTVIGSDKAALSADVGWRGLSTRPTELVNAYGPTEATVEVTRQRVAADKGLYAACLTLPVGRAIANATARARKGGGALAVLGEPAELEVGGAGLARGYLDRPAATAVQLCASSSFDSAGERVYHTGDRVRRLADGCLEFIERVDFQAKVRGFRIELGEIEMQLLATPGVRAAAVVACPDSAGQSRLIAYIVGDGGAAPAATALRERLSARLPAYMVPSVFVELAVLPLTANGKLDRKALPAPEGRAEPVGAYVPPRNATEVALARIWAELLGVERVGVTDDFFRAGGHSLMVTRMLSRVRAAFGVELPLQQVFGVATIAALALLIEEALIEQAAREA